MKNKNKKMTQKDRKALRAIQVNLINQLTNIYIALTGKDIYLAGYRGVNGDRFSIIDTNLPNANFLGKAIYQVDAVYAVYYSSGANGYRHYISADLLNFIFNQVDKNDDFALLKPDAKFFA